jgi:hypothetical protein
MIQSRDEVVNAAAAEFPAEPFDYGLAGRRQRAVSLDLSVWRVEASGRSPMSAQ